MRISTTGHRPNRLHIAEELIALRLREALGQISAAVALQRPGEPMIALSPLAEGADRLFAAAALDLGFRLEAMLPFRSADYERTFSDPARLAEYRALLARADRVIELPGNLSDSDAAYEAMGRESVRLGDIVVAVWDGEPAAGRGGTPDIVAVALGQGRPVVWIDSARDVAPVELRALSPRHDAVALDAAAIVARLR